MGKVFAYSCLALKWRSGLVPTYFQQRFSLLLLWQLLEMEQSLAISINHIRWISLGEVLHRLTVSFSDTFISPKKTYSMLARSTVFPLLVAISIETLYR